MNAMLCITNVDILCTYRNTLGRIKEGSIYRLLVIKNPTLLYWEGSDSLATQAHRDPRLDRYLVSSAKMTSSVPYVTK